MKSETKLNVRWLTSKEAAEYLGFPSVDSFHHFLHRSERRPKVHWLGNRMRFRQVDLDALVEAEPEEQPIRLVAGGKR